MNKLIEIKSNAQKLFAEKEMSLVIEFLLTQLEEVDFTLYNEALLFESERNMILREKQGEFITHEQFNVQRNRLKRWLSEFINDLDNPKQKNTNRKSLSKKQLLRMILLAQVLILIGIGILIYLQRQ
ncbi:MAG: hypothetical protein AB8H03_28370 [Saprospiraceae bacterium]